MIPKPSRQTDILTTLAAGRTPWVCIILCGRKIKQRYKYHLLFRIQFLEPTAPRKLQIKNFIDGLPLLRDGPVLFLLAPAVGSVCSQLQGELIQCARPGSLIKASPAGAPRGNRYRPRAGPLQGPNCAGGGAKAGTPVCATPLVSGPAHILAEGGGDATC